MNFKKITIHAKLVIHKKIAVIIMISKMQDYARLGKLLYSKMVNHSSGNRKILLSSALLFMHCK